MYPERFGALKRARAETCCCGAWCALMMIKATHTSLFPPPQRIKGKNANGQRSRAHFIQPAGGSLQFLVPHNRALDYPFRTAPSALRRLFKLYTAL